MAKRNFNSNALTRTEQAGRHSPKKNGQDGGDMRLRSVDGDKQGPIFEDPRHKNDRRKFDRDDGIPVTGCRRRVERRSDRINLGVWWMKRNYCVDLVAPRRKPTNKPAYTNNPTEKKA